MGTLKKINITQRVKWGMGILISSYLIFILFALYNIQKANNFTDRIYRYSLTVSNTVLKANVYIIKIHRDMKDVVLSNSLSNIRQSIEAVNETEKQVYKELDSMRNILVTEEGKVLETETRKLFDEWKPIRKEVIGLVLAGQKEKAAGITTGKGADHVVLLEKKMSELTRYAINRTLDDMYEAERAHKVSSMTLVFFMILGVSLSSLAAFWVIRKIKLEEDMLKIEKERSQNFLDIAAVIIVALDKEQNVTMINNKGREILGYEEHEIIGENWFDHFIQAKDVEDVKEIFHQIISGNIEQAKYYENAILTKDGDQKIIAWNNSIIKDESGLIAGTLASGQDITERKKAKEDLAENEKYIRRLLNSTTEAIYGLDNEGNCTFANNACFKMLGYKTANELIGKNMHTLIHHSHADGTPYDIQLCLICRLFQKGEMVHLVDEILWRADGTKFSAEYWSHPVIEDGHILGAVVTFLDITERKKLEAQFLQSQKMEAIGTLAGGVAHDFNNILTSILGNCDLALLDIRKDNPLRQCIEEVKIDGERAASLTRHLLAFSRKQVISPKILDLNETLTDIKKMLHRLVKEDIEILIIQDPSLGKVEVDPGQIEQIIINLVVNAQDAMPNGGTLTLETANTDMDEIYFDGHGIENEPGSYVMLTVSDTGIGMDKEIQKHIFEPFYTTKGRDRGTGLGLSTIYGIIKQNKGFIWVYSEPGHGSRFKIYLPVVQGDITTKDEKQIPVKDISGSETILIVEDDNSIKNLMQKVLNKYGYEILLAENGEAALNVSKKHNRSIELMIADVVMPGMNGRETADQVNKLYPQMKVIYMSGYTDNAIAHHGVLEPGLNFIEKPFTPATLARKVREVLDKGSAGF